jgi:hypothetical protein
MVAAAHGSFRVSSALHPFGLPVLAAIMVGAVLSSVRWLTGRPARRIPHRLAVGTAVAAAAGWLAWWISVRLAG